MQVKTIKLKDFRNFKSEQVSLSAGLNVFSGKNAQGKTNLLESIYFSSLGTSPRIVKEKELIRWEADLARVNLTYTRREGERSIEILVPKTGNKTIRVNNLPIKKMGELMGELTCVFFSPDELRLVKDGPVSRRKFLDIDISQLSKVYFYSLQRYLKILAQRNALLKQKANKEQTRQTITIWDDGLSKYAANIILARHQFINELKEQARNIHGRLTGGKESLEISYGGFGGKNAQELTDKLLEKYAKDFDRDFELGFTQTGPHRDDLVLKINGTDIRTYGSQGQQRSAALSLKLAELEIFKAQTGEYPVLLLDDVLSELDENRSAQLLNAITGIQTILTCTGLNINPKADYKKFTVESGRIKTDGK